MALRKPKNLASTCRQLLPSALFYCATSKSVYLLHMVLLWMNAVAVIGWLLCAQQEVRLFCCCCCCYCCLRINAQHHSNSRHRLSTTPKELMTSTT
jgi:hypothetical protein